MAEPLSVSLSGTAMAFLLYENTKSTFGQEGFLIGEIIEKRTSSITDNDEEQEHVSKVIKINSVISCPQLCYFYDGIGQIDEHKLGQFLGVLCTKVVAWYRYRPMFSFKLSFREKIVHKQFARYFNIQTELFTCCLLISESSDNGSTRSFTQNFMRYLGTNCHQLPMHITNLDDPKNSYKSPEPASDTFNAIIRKLKINPTNSDSLHTITQIQNAVQKQIDRLVDDVAEAEETLFFLENNLKDTQLNRKYASGQMDSINYEETVPENVKTGKKKGVTKKKK